MIEEEARGEAYLQTQIDELKRKVTSLEEALQYVMAKLRAKNLLN